MNSYWAILALWTVTAAAAEAPKETRGGESAHTRYVIGLSPFLDDSVKDEVFRQVVRFVLEDLPLNSTLGIYDAYRIRTITHIEIPEVRAFKSSKTRANQFKDRIQELKQFLAAKQERPATTKLNLDQAVRLPQFLDFVGENLTGANQSVIAVLVGSPLYLDDKEPGFSMVEGYFPSDGHVTATREKSVFGARGRADALHNVILHFGYFGDPWMSDVHREKIERFWRLFLKNQGGRLGTFSGDLPTVFQAVKSGSAESGLREGRYELDGSQKIEMLRITRDLGVADWITRDIPANVQRGPPSRTIGPMRIGIRWQGRIDLDLYARPTRRSEMLFFEHTRSAEGYYFKDHRSSPDREYEFIEFLSPVDLWQAEARVNFYDGTAAGGPAGEIRVEFDGRIYVGHFALEADRGNQGRTGRGQDHYWATIDIPKILNLR